MYQTSTYITKRVGNNALWWAFNPTRRLYLPSLMRIVSLDEICLWDQVAFGDEDFSWVYHEYTGLAHVYQLDFWGIPLYLFDNHNHAYYFWHLARLEGRIGQGSTLIHIDAHSDLRDPWIYLKTSELQDLQAIYDYTNFTLNVGNYLVPAVHDGLIKDVIQVRSSYGMEMLASSLDTFSTELIVNLDLDFFAPELDFIPYNDKMSLIKRIFKKARVITVATSPYFINQELALQVFIDLIKKS